MRSLLDVLELADDLPTPTQRLEFADDETERCLAAGNALGAGEWLVEKARATSGTTQSEAIARALSYWAAERTSTTACLSIEEIIERLHEYVPEHLSRALLGLAVRLDRVELSALPRFDDLEFRLADSLAARVVDSRAIVPGKRTAVPARGALARATARYRAAWAAVTSALTATERTGCATARTATLGLVRAVAGLREFTLPGEAQATGAVEVVLGPNFRKFCESCERQELQQIAQKHHLVLAQSAKTLSEAGAMSDSALWHELVRPACALAQRLANEGRGMASVQPSIRVTSSGIRLDLARVGGEHQVPVRIENSGDGDAYAVAVCVQSSSSSADVRVVEPRGPIDLPAHESLLVTLGIKVNAPTSRLTVDVFWTCKTISEANHLDPGKLTIEQQSVQPDWDKLAANPPYPVNAIRRREALFGRDAILQQLSLSAARGTSAFLWGQKRVGKTSVVQVLREELSTRDGFVPLLFRMGEIGALHEGQMAERIASRIAEGERNLDGPRPGEFGAGLGDLIPWVERALQRAPRLRPVVIIDEFDDLDRSFYVGERGRLFMKALRSLSEVGITFFFVGSERMGAIFERHARELNKWENISLDRIESTQDCRSMITQPLLASIEYADDAVDAIVTYCRRNPFYIHLLCSTVFQYCFSERRTFVTEGDVLKLRVRRVQELGATNFAHFWDDNPELDEAEAERQAAENCLALACISFLGGEWSEVEQLVAAQSDLGLRGGEQLGESEIRAAVDRLVGRGVLGKNGRDMKEISLPIFRDWLDQRARAELVDKWRKYLGRRAARNSAGNVAAVAAAPAVTSAFPIGEEELLGVAERLTYLGRQKDVAEIRAWLRQFDDDVRIELAFLLLRRLSEQGFHTHGTKLLQLNAMVDAVRAARLEVGAAGWHVHRGRLTNLAVTFIDGPTKSGGATSRDVAQRLRPGKVDSSERCAQWLLANLDEDPLLVVVDDFAGTGRTLSNGLRALTSALGPLGPELLKEGRVRACLLYAFPEALARLREEHPLVDVVVSRIFGDELRAFEPEASIFATPEELKFARGVMLQIGRELQPQHPLGFGESAALVCFDSAIPNNTLPVFWSNGTVNERPWKPLFPRA